MTDSRPLTEAERKLCERCPWCDGWCQYVEWDETFLKNGKPSHDRRVGSHCKPHGRAFDSDGNDAAGNDYGRTGWESDVVTAIAEYNYRATLEKAGKREVW